MSNPEALIRIREKLASLLGQYHALMQEKQRLTSEIEKLKGLLAQERSQQEVLTTQLSAAKLKTTSLSESEKAAFEKKINLFYDIIEKKENATKLSLAKNLLKLKRFEQWCRDLTRDAVIDAGSSEQYEEVFYFIREEINKQLSTFP